MPDNVRLTEVLPATAHALLSRLAREQANGRAPALLAGVIQNGVLVWSGGRGRLAGAGVDGIGVETEAARDVQFRIGSITKTFTAVLVARLRDEGRLDFDDPIERHLPGTPLGDRTIAQLLSHSSGVQAETTGPWWERTPGGPWEELQKTFGPDMVLHPAGHRFHYSNLGYAFLGELVHRLRGKPWYDVVRAEILEPLGMRRTTYLPEAPHAQGYAVHPWADVVQPEPAHDAGAMAPAGQLWSTIDDLSRWAAFLAGSGDAAVLSGDTLAELREPRVDTKEQAPGGASRHSDHGLGLQILESRGRRLVGHGGSMPGFLAGLFVDTQEGVGAVTLANTTSGVAPGTLAADLVAILSDREPGLPRTWAPADRLPDGVLDLVGVWYWGPAAFALRARGGDGDLDLRPLTGASRASRFRPAGADTWTGLDGYYAGETLRAVRRPDGTVSHLDLASFVFTRAPYDPTAPVPGGVDPAGWRPST